MLSTLGSAASAAEEGMHLGSLQHADELSDGVLGSVRGRYLAQGRIVRFGIEMVSTWQTATGQIYRAGATLDVGLDGKPQVRFVPALSATEAATAPATAAVTTASSSQTNAVHTGAGLASVSGVVQSIQVAGDANQVTNNATITVTSAPAPTPPRPATTGPSHVSAVTGNGAVLSAGIDAQGMSVSIGVPGAGRVVQQIKTAGGAAGPGILQMAQSTADLQRAQNHLNIFVQVSPDAAGRSAPHDSALNTLRAMRGARLF